MNFQNCINFVVIMFLSHVTGQKYNLTRSTEYASLGEAFNLTCGMFIPPNQTALGVYFFRNNNQTALVGMQGSSCIIQGADPRYSYQCLTNNIFLLTIPAENMTEFEQKSTWRCEHIFDANYKSYDVILTIAIEVYNVSLIPSGNPLTIREGILKEFQCVVNSNAVPSPTITWYLVLTDIATRMETNTSSINITSNRKDNGKTLECRASNNNKQPKTASTTLSVEYPPTIENMFKQTIIEGKDLSVTCSVTPGNPYSTTFRWTKVDKPGFGEDRAILQLPNIHRTSSGTYTCTAENIYENREKGLDSQSIVVDVLYPPFVNALSNQDIIEGRDLSVPCQAIHGNPSATTFYWTKVDSQVFRQNGSTLQLSNIQRTSYGTYRCTAENNYNNGERGRHSQSMVVDVLYPPAVSTLSKQEIIEGGDLTVNCTATPGNPSSTTFYWTKREDQGFRQNDSSLQLPNIQRTSVGTYRCTAENNYNKGERGTHNQSMVVDVLYQPTIQHKPFQIVNESETVKLSREISSNPFSNASWYDKINLLKTDTSVTTTTLIIQNASCTDTKNFTLVVQNKVGNDTALVELIVNCKPRSYETDFTLGVTDTTGIDFSTIVIAYPEPWIKLVYENGSVPDQMMTNINRNAVNNFTIHISQAVVNQSDFGVYHLIVGNLFGEITVTVTVIPRRKPNMPDNIKIVCEETRANVEWKSSFNGGDQQLFTVFASTGQHSNNISDRGENVIHSTFVQHLQPSTMYVFYVSAQNTHGFISSEKISCTTLAESSEKLPIIVGSAAAGGLTLVVVVVVVFFLFRRFTNTEKQAGKSQRFENDLVEKESVDDDGLKDNILYVSADPRENEKHEAAVYAAVNKKDPMSNNNSNVYAEVKKNGIKDVKEGAIYSDVKPKKGFFKKDGKVKKEKRQKRKQEVADVYENSDDIAMTANPDNVYSNTNHNNDSDKGQRGYKNKDGLLYVEVKFDTKTEDKNPVIHGDDEKTDYATVEFPVPSSSHDRE